MNDRSIFPPFDLSEEKRRELAAEYRGLPADEARAAVDIAAHAIDAAIRAFEETIDRDNRDLIVLLAKANGIGWLSTYSKVLAARTNALIRQYGDKIGLTTRD